MSKRLLVLLIVLTATLLSLSLPLAFNAEAGVIPKVIVDEGFADGYPDYMHFDVPPIMENGRTLIPLRALCEQLNYQVFWDSASQKIEISKATQHIVLKIGDPVARVNNLPLPLDLPPREMGGVTFVPLRFVTEVLGKNVYYSADFLDEPTIWVTTFSLLKPEDVIYLEQEDPNFMPDPADESGLSLVMKSNGETPRGIRLGDTLQKVYQTYGMPQNDDIDINGTGTITYWSPFAPHSGFVWSMVFTFDQGILTDVTVWLPN